MASTRTNPNPFSPAATVLCAMLLATICVASLLFFINHISKAVNVNFIVHKIARETEAMIDATMPDKRAFKHEDFYKVDIKDGDAEVRSIVSG